MKPKKIILSMLLLLAISFAAQEGVAALNPGSIFIGISAISAGNSPGTFAVLSPAGGTGLYTYQWQELDDSAHWSDIGGEQLPTFTPPALNATTYYRRKVTSGAEVAYSNVVTVYVYEAASSFAQDLELGEDDHTLSTSNNTQSVYLPWKLV